MAFDLNIDENCGAIKISREIYLRILMKAVEQTKEDVRELEQAHLNDQFDTIQTISHRLKGDYGNLRVSSMSENARQINEISKSTKDKNQIGLLINELKCNFQNLQEALKEAAK